MPAGVLLVAKNREAATALHMQFQNRSVRKTYLAIACGVPLEAAFSVDAAVDRHDTIKCAALAGAGTPRWGTQPWQGYCSSSPQTCVLRDEPCQCGREHAFVD